ncbi:hypothetical protein [Novosphingobium gossypii]|uniref:hypothetical protein n=1 Tax=Novosphingobium gossypii TaxID=1604774 RepID=UPI003D1AF499
MLSLTASTQLSGYEGDNGYARDRSGLVTAVNSTGFGPGTPITYDAQRGGFTYSASGFLYYGMPNIENGKLSLASDRSDAIYAVYTGSSNGVSFDVRQLRMGTSNPALPLRFSSIALGQTSYTNTATGETLHGVVPFAFGIPFDAFRTTLTGAGVYEGLVVGNARGMGSSNVYAISGTIHLSIDYQTTAFTCYLDLSGTDDRTGEKVTFPRMTITPFPPRGVLDWLGGDAGRNSRFQANFAGSMAQEVMGAFENVVNDPRAPQTSIRISTAFAARK